MWRQRLSNQFLASTFSGNQSCILPSLLCFLLPSSTLLAPSSFLVPISLLDFTDKRTQVHSAGGRIETMLGSLPTELGVLPLNQSCLHSVAASNLLIMDFS